LDHGNIKLAIGFSPATAYLPDVPGVQAKKQRKLCYPLIQQRLAMYQYQGIALPLGDQPGSDNSLADTLPLANRYASANRKPDCTVFDRQIGP